jgi:hypothetical protein
MSKEDQEEFEGEGKEPVKVFDWMPTGCSPLADGEYGIIFIFI